MVTRHLLLAALAISIPASLALDNGVGQKPIMGFNTWNHFGCDTSQLNETTIMQMADAMVSSGIHKSGYEYINIDDCWPEMERGSDGKLKPDADRFPSGIKALADYVHSKGLKFGIYGDVGTKTCAGYPGSEGYEEVDAQTFADWGVDMLKLDGCNMDVADMAAAYTKWSQALNATGRPIVFSCSWPAYANAHYDTFGFNYTYIGEICNMWRLWNDIRDTWDDGSDTGRGVVNILNYWDYHTSELVPAAGPGKINDPDMLEVGNGGLTSTEYTSHFSLWSVITAPLILGNDLRVMDADTIEILTNDEVIAVDQDPGVVQGQKVLEIEIDDVKGEVWMKPLSDGSFAIVLFNPTEADEPLSVKWSAIGLKSDEWFVRDLWKHKDLGVFKDHFSTTVASHGVVMIRVKAASEALLPLDMVHPGDVILPIPEPLQ